MENDEVRIERCLFASQEYTELLIAHVVLTRLGSKGELLYIDCSFGENILGKTIVVPVEVNEQVTSVDIEFTVKSRNSEYV